MLFTAYCFLLLLASAVSSDDESDYTRALKAYANEIDSSCCIILYNYERFYKERTRIIRLVHALARDFAVDLSVTALHFTTFLHQYRIHPRYLECKSPMIIIIHNDRTTQRYFETISNLMAMHDVIWFIFDIESIEDWFKNIYVPFGSTMLVAKKVAPQHVEIYELYRVEPDRPLRYPKLGDWTAKDGLMINTNVVYDRRSNLEGIVLRTGSTQNEPIHSFQKSSSGELELVGYFPEVWHQLELILNFTSVHYKSVDNVTGINEDGSWNGLIGMLLRNEIDVAVSEFIMDGQRSHVVDFTRPLVKTSYQIFFKNVGADYNWDAILRPFHTETWLAILIWTIVASIMLTILHKASCRYGLEANTNDFSLINTFLFHLRAICSQGYPTIPRSSTCRILFVSAYLVNGLLVPSYSAYLISYLTFRTPKRPFDDLEGLLKDGTYKLQTNAKTAEYTYFAEATDPTILRIYKELMIKIPPEDFPLNTQEALDRVCADPHLAHFGDMAVAYSYLKVVKAQKQCDIVTLSKSISTVYSSMALRKRSPYRMAINHFLQRMEDHGLVDRLLDASFPLDKTYQTPGINNVDVTDVAQTFILLLLGFMLAIIVLIIEIGYWRWKTKKYIFEQRHGRKAIPMKVMEGIYDSNTDFTDNITYIN